MGFTPPAGLRGVRDSPESEKDPEYFWTWVECSISHFSKEEGRKSSMGHGKGVWKGKQHNQELIDKWFAMKLPGLAAPHLRSACLGISSNLSGSGNSFLEMTVILTSLASRRKYSNSYEYSSSGKKTPSCSHGVTTKIPSKRWKSRSHTN